MHLGMASVEVIGIGQHLISQLGRLTYKYGIVLYDGDVRKFPAFLYLRQIVLEQQKIVLLQRIPHQ